MEKGDTPLLIDGLRSPDRDVRVAAFGKLILGRDVRAAKILLALVHKEPDPALKVAMIRALKFLADRQEAPSLVPFVLDEEDDVRLAAIDALIGLGNPGTFPVIMRGVFDLQPPVRKICRDFLLALGHENIALLMGKMLEAEPWWMREVAVLVVVRVPSKQALEMLEFHHEDGEPRLKDLILSVCQKLSDGGFRPATEFLGRLSRPRLELDDARFEALSMIPTGTDDQSLDLDINFLSKRKDSMWAEGVEPKVGTSEGAENGSGIPDDSLDLSSARSPVSAREALSELMALLEPARKGGGGPARGGTGFGDPDSDGA